MKNCSPYIKLRVLGAIDFADGNNIRERIKNVAQSTFVDEEYNSKKHSSTGMKPIDRFGLDLTANRIQFLPPSQFHDEIFFFEEDRKVKIDNTFSLKNIRYEAPRDLRGKTIQVRFDRNNKSHVIVFYKAERMGEAKILNPIDNDRFIYKNKGDLK